MRFTYVNDESRRARDSLKTFRAILNKITPQNNEKLFDELSILTFNSEERVNAVTNVLFEHVVNSHCYIPQFVSVSKHLASLTFVKTDENGSQRQLSFLDVLLKKCQSEFEADIYKRVDIEELNALIENTIDDNQRSLLVSELDVKKWNVKRRFMGILKFIGELYLQDLLHARVIISCIDRLSKKSSQEELIECLCTLLKVVGFKLEIEARNYEQREGLRKDSVLVTYFSKLQKFESNKQITSRLRFMIRDMFEMRANGWKTRKAYEEIKPKKIDEIHSEAMAEL